MKIDDKAKCARVQYSVVIPGESWVEFLTHWPDIFGQNYIGYWARGCEQDDNLGWLIYEDCNKDYHHNEEPDREEAVKAWKEGSKLPKDWHRLGREEAATAYLKGCELWGKDWFDEKGDAETYDVVIQLTLLGEIRYG